MESDGRGAESGSEILREPNTKAERDNCPWEWGQPPGKRHRDEEDLIFQLAGQVTGRHLEASKLHSQS